MGYCLLVSTQSPESGSRTLSARPGRSTTSGVAAFQMCIGPRRSRMRCAWKSFAARSSERMIAPSRLSDGADLVSHGGPRLSVTVLNYNYGRFLSKCLTSILSQSYTDFELIVIDDASTDESTQAIEPFLKDPPVRLIAHKQNAAFHRSLVEGADASSSPYLTV